MSNDVSDLSFTIIPKSDQLNADQLLSGPMTIRITSVAVGAGDDQPVVVHYEGENGRPYKPCKSMRKLLIFAWGSDGRAWAGKSATLFHAPEVKFGGEMVGGIRISHMSDIPKDISVSLTSTKGKKALHNVKVLRVTPTVDHHAAMRAAGDVEALKGAFGAAYKSTKDAAAREAYKATYDARMAEITKPETTADEHADFKAGLDAGAAA